MKKRDKEKAIAIPADTVRKLTEFAESLEGQTVVVVKRLPEQKSMTVFLAEYARTGRVAVACGLAGLPKTTYYRYKRRNPEFGRRCQEIKETFKRRAARKRAERMKREMTLRLTESKSSLAVRYDEVMSLLSAVARDEGGDDSDES